MENVTVPTSEVAAEPALSDLQVRIMPDAVSLDVAGLVLRHFVIRLPKGVTLTTVHERSKAVWRLVQRDHAKALRRLDRVTLIAADESFVADAYVTGATSEDVTLARPTVVKLDPRSAVLPGDDKYRIEFQDGGYCVIRRSDNQRMTLPVASLQVALNDMANLYPRHVA